MANFYQVKKTIGDVEYTAQFNGVSTALDAIDQSYIEGSNNTSLSKMSNYLLEHVLVEPKVTLDDFDSVTEFNELVSFLREVMQGDLKPEDDKKPTKKKAE